MFINDEAHSWTDGEARTRAELPGRPSGDLDAEPRQLGPLESALEAVTIGGGDSDGCPNGTAVAR